jgi:hypothetical protein
LVAALVLVHSLALAAAFISLEGWQRYAIWALVFGSLVGTLARAFLLTPYQPVSLELNEDGRVSWKNRDGSWREGRLGADQFVSTALAVVELRDDKDQARRLVLMADSMPHEDFRQLRVWLRWRPSAPRPEPE